MTTATATAAAVSTHPINEPVRDYAPGSADYDGIRAAIGSLEDNPRALPMRIGGKDVVGGGTEFTVVAPHAHHVELGSGHSATPGDVNKAIAAALAAAPEWSTMSQEERSAIFLRAADLLAGPWRYRANAATMMGQSKTVFQAEIDAACELIDFWRWNVHFAAHLNDEQPISPDGVRNEMELRPLEGFVLAITPFNFSSIAGNLPTSPAIVGNVVVWKPARTQQLAASLILEVLEEAGLPPGVINMVTGDGRPITEAALAHESLAGIHYTGSTEVFQGLWQGVANNVAHYKTFPRLVGETGGKDFVLAHPSADVAALSTALIRGAFEYQGQKCSAASRAYIPKSLWSRMKNDLADVVNSLPMGDVADLTNFMGAVIDDRSYGRLTSAIDKAKGDSHLTLIAGGSADNSQGWFIRPTVYQADSPKHELMERELFGPVLTLYVYDDADWDATLQLVDTTSPYALTGAVFAQDRSAIDQAKHVLRNAAGNFYINDKPTGAVVGQQPFGGARASGTNDKAGSSYNLHRWVSPRAIKETFSPPTQWRYPHMGAER